MLICQYYHLSSYTCKKGRQYFTAGLEKNLTRNDDPGPRTDEEEPTLTLASRMDSVDIELNAGNTVLLNPNPHLASGFDPESTKYRNFRERGIHR